MFAVELVVGRMLEVGLLVALLEQVGPVEPRSLRTFGGLAWVVGEMGRRTLKAMFDGSGEEG
jgi:hypothetical protein